jgi:hypothetical protein
MAVIVGASQKKKPMNGKRPNVRDKMVSEQMHERRNADAMYRIGGGERSSMAICVLKERKETLSVDQGTESASRLQ